MHRSLRLPWFLLPQFPLSRFVILLVPTLTLTLVLLTTAPAVAQTAQEAADGSPDQAAAAAPPSADDLDTLRRAVEGDLDNVDLRKRFARALLAAGEPYPAIDQLDEALHRAPDDPVTYQILGTCYRRVGKPDQALASFRKALELDPDLVPARAALASVLAEQGDLDGAIRALGTILENHPDRFGLHLARADLQLRAGRPEKAVPDLARAVELRPSDVPARLTEHAVLARLGRYGEARDVLEQGLAANAGNAALSDALARLLALCPDETVRDPARALTLADTTYRAESTPDHAVTLALALAANGRFEEAAQVQGQLVAAAKQGGAPQEVIQELEKTLAAYKRGELPEQPDQPVSESGRPGNGS